MSLHLPNRRALFGIAVLGLFILGGSVYRIVAAGVGPTAATSPNLRQPYANTKGLVAWYPLDGDAKDYSGNNNKGHSRHPTPDTSTSLQ